MCYGHYWLQYRLMVLSLILQMVPIDSFMATTNTLKWINFMLMEALTTWILEIQVKVYSI